MRAGRPELSFELGSGPLRITLPQKVADGRQHTLVARRTGREGQLELDGVYSETGETPGYLTMMNTNGNIYIGQWRSPHRVCRPCSYPAPLTLHSVRLDSTEKMRSGFKVFTLCHARRV